MAALPTDFGARQHTALGRVDDLIAHSHERARHARRWYYTLQGATIGLAAITPCLILIAQGNNGFLQWLSAFVPAFAAIAAGLSHIFNWRQDGVRSTALEASLRSERWRYQTRTGDYGVSLTDEQALDHLVTQVDTLNLHAVAEWSAEQLATPATTASPPKEAATQSPAPHT